MDIKDWGRLNDIPWSTLESFSLSHAMQMLCDKCPGKSCPLYPLLSSLFCCFVINSSPIESLQLFAKCNDSFGFQILGPQMSKSVLVKNNSFILGTELPGGQQWKEKSCPLDNSIQCIHIHTDSLLISLMGLWSYYGLITDVVLFFFLQFSIFCWGRCGFASVQVI